MKMSIAKPLYWPCSEYMLPKCNCGFLWKSISDSLEHMPFTRRIPLGLSAAWYPIASIITMIYFLQSNLSRLRWIMTISFSVVNKKAPKNGFRRYLYWLLYASGYSFKGTGYVFYKLGHRWNLHNFRILSSLLSLERNDSYNSNGCQFQFTLSCQYKNVQSSQ